MHVPACSLLHLIALFINPLSILCHQCMNHQVPCLSCVTSASCFCRGAEPHELAPVIDFLRSHLGLTPSHVETHPHEEDVEQEAGAEVM